MLHVSLIILQENHFNLAPIGTILAWTPYPDTNSHNIVSIPNGWVECNGSVITEGIWKGRRTPDLNNAKRFLRGGNISEVLQMESASISDQNLRISHNSLTYKDIFYAGYDRSCSSDGATTYDFIIKEPTPHGNHKDNRCIKTASVSGSVNLNGDGSETLSLIHI